MILSVSFQLEVFFTTIAIGLAIGFFYDLLKVFRLLIIHNRIFIDLEDIVFWIVMSVLVFFVSLYQTKGEIRAYFLIGIFLGILLYFSIISKHFIKYTTIIINSIKKYINLVITKVTAKVLNIFCKFKNILKSKFKNTNNIITKNLVTKNIIIKNIIQKFKNLFTKFKKGGKYSDTEQ